MKAETGISRKKRVFLETFLPSISLENLLPIYVAAISKNPDLFPILPETLIGPTIEGLRRLQEVVGVSSELSEERHSKDDIERNLVDVDIEALLELYVSVLSQNKLIYDELPEEIRAPVQYWLSEIKACVTGKNGLFSIDFDLEEYFDGFIRFSGGIRLTDRFGPGLEEKNADYLFEDQKVIVELKILKQDFVQSQKEKIDEAVRNAMRSVKITPGMILGTDKSVPQEVVDATSEVLKKPLQNIVKSANKQIKESKGILSLPDGKGVLAVLVDGFYSIDPFLMANIFHKIITFNYSCVNVVLLISFRRRVKLNLGDGEYNYLIFEPRYKTEPSQDFADFINAFGSSWFDYPQVLSGNRFGKKVLSYDARNLEGGVWK